MRIDFIIFTLLITVGIAYIFNSSKKIWYFYAILLLIFIIVMRIDPKGVDFVEYYRYLHYFSYDFRHIREIAYFLPSFSIYSLVHNEIITFILMDFIWLYVLLNIQKNVNLKFNTNNYALIMILFTSFPLFFGYENIYRQLFAEIFSLYAYSLKDRSSSKSNLFFLIAIFMHNTALVILPFLIIKRFFKFKLLMRISISTFIVFCFNSLFIIASQYKSGHETGLNMSIYYFAIFCILFYILLIKNKFHIIGFIEKFPSVYIGIILMLGLINLPVGMVSERMGMFFLIFVIYDLYIYSINMTKTRQVIFRIGLLLIFSLPVLLFNSSRQML